MRFVRKAEYLDRSGFCKTEFHQAQKKGRISAPDAYIGPRTPVWLETTVERDLKKILNAPKPIETRPLRRRRRSSNNPA
jgi:hypothetical protein